MNFSDVSVEYLSDFFLFSCHLFQNTKALSLKNFNLLLTTPNHCLYAPEILEQVKVPLQI